MSLKNCIRITVGLEAADVDAILEAYDTYKDSMSSDDAAIAAIDDTIASAQQERQDLLAIFEAAYPKEPAKKGEPPVKKMDSTGDRLRRIQDGIDKYMDMSEKETDIPKALEHIYKATSRADVFAFLQDENATPGTIRFLETVRNNILPFKEWYGRQLGAGRGRYRLSFDKAITNVAKNDMAEVMKVREYQRGAVVMGSDHTQDLVYVMNHYGIKFQIVDQVPGN